MYKRQPRSTSRGVNSAGMPFTQNRLAILPTLGLSRYQNEEIVSNNKNPFSFQKETEKLFVVREREREIKESNKQDKEGLRVF